MRQKNYPEKGKYPKRAQIGPKKVFSVLQVDIPWNHMHSPNLKRNDWKLLHLWPTELSGTQNCPIPIIQLWDTIWNLRHYYNVDSITKEKPVKFQDNWSGDSTVMRLCNFVPRKVSVPQKGHKLAPNLSFLFFRWRYLEIMCTIQIWSETVEHCSFYDRPLFLGPKIAPFP